MAIENRELKPKVEDQAVFKAAGPLAVEEPFGRRISRDGPSPLVPAAQESVSKRGGFRQELMELFIDCFCRENPIYLKKLMDSFERRIIVKVLEKTRGNQKEAAQILGIKYTTLNQKVKKYGIRFQKGFLFLES